MSLKKLPPTQRTKYRYLKFRVHAEGKIGLGELVDEIWKNSIEFLGAKDCSKADFWVIGNKFDENSQEGIIKVQRTMADDFIANLCLINSFGDSKGFIEVLKVSGSIKKLD